MRGYLLVIILSLIDKKMITILNYEVFFGNKMRQFDMEEVINYASSYRIRMRHNKKSH